MFVVQTDECLQSMSFSGVISVVIHDIPVSTVTVVFDVCLLLQWCLTCVYCYSGV